MTGQIVVVCRAKISWRKGKMKWVWKAEWTELHLGEASLIQWGHHEPQQGPALLPRELKAGLGVPMVCSLWHCYICLIAPHPFPRTTFHTTACGHRDVSRDVRDAVEKRDRKRMLLRISWDSRIQTTLDWNWKIGILLAGLKY